MNRVEGKVALITGAARRQGRAHAIGLAEERADIIALDLSCDIDTVPYRGATEDDLAHTATLLEEAGQRIVPVVADVRDLPALQVAVLTGVETIGRIDISIANAGHYLPGVRGKSPCHGNHRSPGRRGSYSRLRFLMAQTGNRRRARNVPQSPSSVCERVTRSVEMNSEAR